MKILIIGTGALGILFGTYLQREAQGVTYMTRTATQAQAIRDGGVCIHPLQGDPLRLYPQALYMDEAALTEELCLAEYDLVMVTVKQPALDQVLLWLKRNLAVTVPVLFLMNGLGHRQKVEENLAHDIFWGITQNGARRIESTEVEEKGRGTTKIGIIRRISNEGFTILTSFIQLLKDSGLEVVYTEAIEIEMWKKCIVNACINPLTAIFNVNNGALVEDAHLQRLMQDLYQEIAQLIARVKPETETQKILANGELWQEIEKVCRITSANLSSMVQDLQSQRQTEIESITGYFLKLGEREQIKLPTNRFVYEAIHFLQKQR